MADERRLYRDLSWTWPIISSKEEYIAETLESVSFIRENSGIDVRTILNLGCGGGHNDYTLKRHFDVTGVDISPDMLSLARDLNPEVSYLEGDMRTVRLGRVFDAVVIFDSISYMLTVDDLGAAFVTAFEHLKPGGVFLTIAEYTKENFEQNKTLVTTNSKEGIEITFIENNYDPDPSDTTFKAAFVFIIRRGGMLEIETDRHVVGVFGLETWRRTLREAGFEYRELENRDGYLNFVCVRAGAGP